MPGRGEVGSSRRFGWQAATVPADVTTVYTDGACQGNPGPGGWAWAVPGGRWAAGPAARTTNQRMELTAVLEALLAIEGPVEVVSDSTYVVNCFRDRWWEGWLRRGWTSSKRTPVANRDLWEPIVGLYLEREPRPRFRWVKGHGGDPMNDLVDRLAVQACATQAPSAGETPPDPATLGPPDRPGAGSGAGPAASGSPAPAAAADPTVAAAVPADPRVPVGHRLVAFGHRPTELGGYDASPVADTLRRTLTDIFTAKAQLHPDLVVLTGLNLGAETLAAEAASAAGVAYVAILAYPDPDRRWPAGTRARFRELLAGARATVTLERKVPASAADVATALARRNGWLIGHAHEAVLVWDGHDPNLARLHAKLERRFGDDVWIVEPPARAD